MHWLGTLGFLWALLHLSACLRLGAFNIQSFGDKKASNPTVMNIISTIVHRYDIILIQEVRDKDLTATRKLMDYVNSGSPQFAYIVSEPLGPSTYKERYLFLFRPDLVSVSDSYQYKCESCDINISRDPFVVRFSSTNTAKRDFTLIPLHTSPTHAVRELQALSGVVADVRAHWNTNDIVLLGDFNAGCSYVTSADFTKIDIYNDHNFHWLIPDNADTTVSGSNCPYDRIVVTSDMMAGVDSSTAGVYNFKTDMHLSQKQALDVSNHYPVEVELTH